MKKLAVRTEDWLSTVAESPKTRNSYLEGWHIFEEFCKERAKDANSIVDDYLSIKYLGEAQRERFVFELREVLKGFYVYLKPKFASLSAKHELAIVKSYLNYWKVPVDIDLPKHPFVTYHNRDIEKEEVKQILTFASARDKVMYMLLVESGARVDNITNLKYWQIKEDFEAHKIPMKILMPSPTLKDQVGDRWSFIGEDGFNELSNYLARRSPIKDDEYVFLSEKQGRVTGAQFSPASLSTKFNRIVQKLKIAESLGQAGKPKRIRLHGLRKYFRNNMKADSAFVNFWMAHSLGVDSHYISRDVEEHRKLYAKGYKNLRIFTPSKENLADLYHEINAITQSMAELQQENKELKNRITRIEDKLKIKPRPPFEIPPEVEDQIEKAEKMSKYFENHEKEVAGQRKQKYKT